MMQDVYMVPWYTNGNVHSVMPSAAMYRQSSRTMTVNVGIDDTDSCTIDISLTLINDRNG